MKFFVAFFPSNSSVCDNTSQFLIIFFKFKPLYLLILQYISRVQICKFILVFIFSPIGSVRQNKFSNVSFLSIPSYRCTFCLSFQVDRTTLKDSSSWKKVSIVYFALEHKFAASFAAAWVIFCRTCFFQFPFNR